MEDWKLVNSSPLNFMEEMEAEKQFLPKKISLHDTTLRDGEQFAGVVFTKEDKVLIGKALSELGVHRVEVMPAVSQDDFEAVKELTSLGLSSEIVGFCRSVKGDIQKAADAGCPAIELEITTFPPLIEAFGWSFEETTSKIIKASHFAKEKGLRVTAFLMLATQSPWDFVQKIIEKILKEGAIDAIALPDTRGTCLPRALYHFVRRVKSLTDKCIEIHPHNTYGMGTAGALAAAMAGAEVIHTCVNGLGEGGGNAPLETVAVDLELMLGIKTGIKLEKLYEVSQLVEKLSQIPLQANWPLVGERVFTQESGIAVDAGFKLAKAGKANPPGTDIAGIIGRERRIIVGKMSGGTSIKVKMERLGIPVPDDAVVMDILNRVKAKAIDKHHALTDEEFKMIIDTTIK